MLSKMVELTNFFYWGKFMVMKFTMEEWRVESQIGSGSLLAGRGWTPKHLWVLDLQTGEGAFFLPGGHASYDLENHQIWVCPMFEVFLKWLYEHPEFHEDIVTMPSLIELTDEETMRKSSLYGHRHSGPTDEERVRITKETERAIHKSR